MLLWPWAESSRILCLRFVAHVPPGVSQWSLILMLAIGGSTLVMHLARNLLARELDHDRSHQILAEQNRCDDRDACELVGAEMKKCIERPGSSRRHADQK